MCRFHRLHVPLPQAACAASTGLKCRFHGLQVQFPQLTRSRHKKRYISFVLLSTFRNFATKTANLLRLGKAQIHLAFHSTFRNFAGKKGKWIVGVYYIM